MKCVLILHSEKGGIIDMLLVVLLVEFNMARCQYIKTNKSTKLSVEIGFKALSHTIFYTKLNVWPIAKITDHRAGRYMLYHFLLFPG